MNCKYTHFTLDKCDFENKSGSKKDFYTIEAVDALIAEYEKIEVNLWIGVLMGLIKNNCFCW